MTGITTSALVDLEMVQQATFNLALEFLNDDETPIDITGADLSLVAVYTIDPTEPTFTATGTIDDGPEGLASFEIGSDVTTAMRPGRWTYDVFLQRTGFLDDGVPFSGTLRVRATIGGAT